MEPGRPERWAIVGGGMLGLTLARRLVRAGRRVTLYEAAESIGGLASAWTLDDVVWDRHYHVTLLSDGATRGLLAELDLDDEIEWVVTRTGFWDGRGLHPLSDGIDYLRLPSLGLVDKLRIATTIVRASRMTDWERLERIPVEDWLVGLSGRRAFDRLWRPLLAAKLGPNWPDASAAFLWATIQRLYAARRTGLKREMFGSVRGGYARVLERFERRLREDGVELRTDTPVREVGPAAGGGVRVDAAEGADTFDGCVVTVPPPVAERFCRGLSDDERERMRGVRYQGIVCASVLLDEPLAGYYLTYLTEEMPFTAIVEMTALIDPEQLGGRHLVYLPRYVPSGDPFLRTPDEEIEATFLGALARVHPGFDRSSVRAFRVSRVPHVFAVPTLGYSERLPPVATSVPGLHLVTSAHIVNGTLNVNETVRLAEEAAGRLLAAPPAGARARTRADAGRPAGAPR